MSAGTLPRTAVRRRVVPAVLILLAGLCSLAPCAAAHAASAGGVSISAGGHQSCAVENGKAFCWGYNQFGQLGDGSTDNSSVPVAVDTSGVLAGKTLAQVAVGYEYSACALDSTGEAYCWGGNWNGQLGDGSTDNSSVPVAVDTSGVLAGKTLTQISSESAHTCALASTGRVYCWGLNRNGELGDDGTTNSTVPVAVDTSGVLAGKTLTRIAVDGESTCALDSAGAAYCWGWNGQGQLGNGTTTSSNVPVAVSASGVLAGKTLTQIAGGDDTACAVDTAGAAYCWGDNTYGQLGDESSTSSSVPVDVDTSGVLAGKTLTQVAVGAYQACALAADGVAYCWGYGGGGELGDGGTTNSTVPVAVDTSGVLAGKTLAQISGGSGASHTCAVDTAGAAYCWGGNDFGELGNDSTSDSDVPVLAGPQAPDSVHAVAGRATATVSWFAPASLDTGTLAGYTATAEPGGAACSTTGATTCTITGLASATTYTVTVVAHTSVGDSGASAPAIVTLAGGPIFTSTSAATAAFGEPFSFTVTATGTPAPKITNTGRLPSGVKFTHNGNGIAIISGTPSGTAAGVYPLTLTATNTNGAATQAFTMTVTRAPALPKIRTIRLRAGAALHRIIRATGYPTPKLSESGPLPRGLTFTDKGNGTAVIARTPAAGSCGCYRITITATNASGTATRHFEIIIRQRRSAW